MEEGNAHVVPLRGGGKLVKRKIGNIDVSFHHAPNGNVSLISNKEFSNMAKKSSASGDSAIKKAKKSERGTSGSKSRSSHGVHKKNNGSKAAVAGKNYRAGLKEQYNVDKIKDQATGQINALRNNPLYKKERERQRKATDITHLVDPFTILPEHRRVLSYLMGTENERDIERLASLTHAGIVNAVCPPQDNPLMTEEYIDVITGVKSCREPSVPRTYKDKDSKDKKCPDPEGDPFAIEKYLNEDGTATCERPVVRGYFQCPPLAPGKEELKYRHTLADGTGICLDYDPNKINYKAESMPDTITMLLNTYPDKIKEFFNIYYSSFNGITMGKDSIDRLNSLLISNLGYKDFLREISRDDTFKVLYDTFKNMNSDQHLKIVNLALYKHILDHGSYFRERPTIGDRMRFFGVPYSGGKKRKGSKKSVKKPKKVSKPKKASGLKKKKSHKKKKLM
jgi:hypothetical protein